MAAFLGFFCLRAEAQVQWNLVWSDEFDGAVNTPPNPTKWAYDKPTAGSGNGELETYCGQTGAGQSGDCSNWVENAYLDGQGNLVIAAILHPDGTWTSARLITHSKFTFTYGRVEARMKLPFGAGLWPAFWMLGDDFFSGTPWPDCGEQDMMENVLSLGASTIRASLNGPNYSGSNSLHADYTFPSGGRVDTAYHIYGAIWTTNSVQYYVDDYTHPFVSFTPASMPTNGVWAFNNHPFFILLNLAVGGGWPGNPDSTTPNPANMYVDYVRVYQPTPPPGLYEAEYAAVSGAMVTNYWAGYSGTGYVDYQNASGDYIEWTVSAGSTGTNTLQFRYANGAHRDRPLELKVNGVVTNSRLSFPPTGAWDTWMTASNTAVLTAGTNTVRLTAIGSGGGDLDYLMVLNSLPTASITSPTNGASFVAAANLTITASASDTQGTISKVEFFQGATKLGEDTTSPYSLTWSNVAAGTYSLTVRASDNLGASNTSSAVTITVVSNAAPTVAITSPTNGTVLTAPATFILQASASDSDGTVTQVQFFYATTSLGVDTTSPYSAALTGVPHGNYTFSAVATDNLGAKNTNSTSLIVNAPPIASITSPTNGTSFLAPANITIAASASDIDGSITNLEFFQGASKLGQTTTSPYSLTWSNVAAGAYSLTVRATDNRGAATTSAAISVSVTNSPPLPVTLQNPAWVGTNFVFSFSSQAGHIYQIQFNDLLGSGPWQVLTNVAGTGGVLTVTNQNASSSARFYRVNTQ